MRVITPGEIATLTVCSIFLFFQLIAVIYLNFNRNYAPLKAKQISLMSMTFLSSCIHFIAAVNAFKFVSSEGAFSICLLWDLWLQIPFGLYLWIVCLEFRFWKLFYLLKLKQKASWKMYLFFLFIWGPSLIAAIVGTAANLVTLEMGADGYAACIMSNGLLLFFMAYAFALFVLFILFGIFLRNIHHTAFKEFKETVVSSIFAIIVLIAYCVLIYLEFHFKIYGRIVIILLIEFLMNFNFWITLGAPIFYSLKDRKGYEEQFLKQVAEDSVNSVRLKARTHSPSHSESNDPIISPD